MKSKKMIIKIFVLILIFVSLFNNIYVFANENVDENLEEKFKLLEEAKKEYEQDLINESGTWRGKKYTYANGFLSGSVDTEGKFCYDGFSGNTGIEYNNYAKMQDYVQESVGEYFKQYLNSENGKEKLKGYFLGSQSIYTREYEYKEYDDIEARISVFFVPESNKNEWCKIARKAYTKVYYNEIKDFIEIEGYSTRIYVHLVWENDRYVVKFVDNKPEGYDEYVARMKEHGIDVENIDYASLINAEVNVKQEIMEAEKKEFDAKQIAVGSLRNIIVISFGSIIALIILINILINRKNKLKK